jgi:uroporphyrinogen decarboxylase
VSETLLAAALARRNTRRPPVWLMRQAGRYHRHYQALRARHDFIALCKQPALAAEVTMGPIEEFEFDAAILFSDLLFPLEALGMGLRYEPGPKLDWYLSGSADLARLRDPQQALPQLEFQAEAIRLLRPRLGPERALIGFVGGPFTLYAYAVAGSHEGFARRELRGLEDGLYAGFCERLGDLLADNMVQQARAGADSVALFDTAAGVLDVAQFARHVVTPLARVVQRFRASCPDVPLIYYSRDTGPDHWRALDALDLQCLGVDWRHDLAATLRAQSPRWCLQGNLDPGWLLLPAAELEANLRRVFASVAALPPATRAAWVCGLGHGVLPQTPESNVHLLIRIQHEVFS